MTILSTIRLMLTQFLKGDVFLYCSLHAIVDGNIFIMKQSYLGLRGNIVKFFVIKIIFCPTEI